MPEASPPCRETPASQRPPDFAWLHRDDHGGQDLSHARPKPHHCGGGAKGASGQLAGPQCAPPIFLFDTPQERTKGGRGQFAIVRRSCLAPTRKRSSALEWNLHHRPPLKSHSLSPAIVGESHRSRCRTSSLSRNNRKALP